MTTKDRFLVEEYHVISQEWDEGAYETMIEWILDEMVRNKQTIEQIHELYVGPTIPCKIGKNQTPITEEQFFLAYKSAELVLQDRLAWEKVKPKPLFHRVSPKD